MSINWKNVGPARWYDWKLGMLSDADLSKAAKIPVHIISYRRKQLGIEPFSVSDKIKPLWRLLGSYKDKDIARIAGTSAQAVSRYRRSIGTERQGLAAFSQLLCDDHPLKPYTALVGRVADTDLATLAGVSVDMVESLRTELGIEKFISQPGNQNNKYKSSIYKYGHLILSPDITNELLAQLAGISHQRVSVIRREYFNKLQ